MITEVLRESLETRDHDALASAYTDDVLLDAHVPNWRFQVKGRDAVIDLLRHWFPHPGRFTVWELQLLRLDDGRSAEQLVYCAGRWDEAHVTDMRRQAPLVKP